MVKVKTKKNKKEEELEKEYIVIYESQEHFEVLGFIKAHSLEEAKNKAQKELLEEAEHYNVSMAEVAEIKDLDKVFFKIAS